jgi:regulator of sigma E protease
LGAAVKGGFKVGDLVMSIDGVRIESLVDMNRIVGASAERELTFEVKRSGASVLLKATPERREISDRFGNKLTRGVIGIRRNASGQELIHKRYGVIEAIGLGIKQTLQVIGSMTYLPDVIVGRKADQLGGPLRIATASHQEAARAHWALLLNLTGFLSVGLGLLMSVVQLGIWLVGVLFNRAPLDS